MNHPIHQFFGWHLTMEDTSTDGILKELDPAIQKEVVFQKQKEYKLAYRYDGQLLIGDEAIYPDFTIKRTDGKIFYWEHAGRCDQQRYRDEIMWKLRLYESAGIGQWDNLILTFDVEDGRIDMREVENAIRMKLLV